MLRKLSYLSLLFFFFSGHFDAIAQIAEIPQQHDKCGHTQMEAWLESRDPDYKKRREAQQLWFEKQLKLQGEAPALRVQSTLKIPVVVHVMHAPGEAIGTQSNITDAQIRSQIVVLNEDFRKMAGSRGFNTHPVGADSEIEFCLATLDPNGNPTTGINRVSYANSNNHGFGNDQSMKALSIWPTHKYLNIWIVKNMGGILGYAYLPSDMATDPDRTQIDGVVIGCRYFGSRDKQDLGEVFNLATNFDLGRTTTHEVGHYLNLLHIWGDGDCTIDDDVNDTPNCSGQYFGCGVPPVQCGNTRMIENYMDYSDDRCMNIYTEGQKTRMRTALTVYPFRASLYNPANIMATGCSDSNIVAYADTFYIINGNNQLVRINQLATNNLQVRVVNQLGGGYANHPVRYELITQPAGSQLFLDTVVNTTGNGTVNIPFRIGGIPGEYVVRATTSVARGGQVDFQLRAISTASVYPNPFEKEVIIKLDLPAEENVKVQVFDLSGRLVLGKDYAVKTSFILDMEGFPEGLYTIRVISSQLTDFFRVVKMNL